MLLIAMLAYREVNNSVHLIKPSATALLEDRYGNFLSESPGDMAQELGYWQLSGSIPYRIKAAFLTTEDRRFYLHSGLDWRAVLRALLTNLTTSKRQGASTIAMQVARMQQSASSRGKRTYWKKFCESLTAVLLIRKFGHQAVLKHYLEIVPQGNRIHGVAYAARRYFRKPLHDISWAEAAVLAALPKAPGEMNLFRAEGRKKAFTRAEQILTALYDNGTLSAEDLLAARRQLQHLTIPERETRPQHSYHAILHLEEQLRAFPAQPLYTQPVRTCLDLSVQDQVATIAGTAITHARAAGAGNIAVMVVEKTTGKVVAYLGSHEYYNSAYAGAINYARVPRSSGSTLKPFIYALGLETNRFSPASVLSDTPILVSLPRGYHRIGNYDGQDMGLLLYRKALANSRNVPAIHVLANVGVGNVYELSRQLGLVTTKKPADYYGLGLAIGTLYVTLEDLVTAYGVLANDGKRFHLRWFETPLPEQGNHSPHTSEQLMDANVTRQISLFLSDPLARLPTFPRMGALEYPFPVAVKTGTSQGFRDAWAIAYSSKYLVGVWIGHPDNTRMRDISGATAAQVVKRILLRLHPEERRGVTEQMFPAPENYSLVKVCAPTGKPATESCPEVIPEYFRPGTEPLPSRERRHPAGSWERGHLAHIPAGETPALHPAFSPFSIEKLLNAGVAIKEPVCGETFFIDPDTPRGTQTLPLQATATPAVSQIIWYVDGKPFTHAPYPYTVRWPLQPGTHTIQARFAHADIVSDVVTIRIEN